MNTQDLWLILQTVETCPQYPATRTASGRARRIMQEATVIDVRAEIDALPITEANDGRTYGQRRSCYG